MTPALTLLYTHTEKKGYGRMGIKLADALEAQGVTVVERQGRPNEDEHFMEPADPAKPAGKTNVVCSVSYPTHLRGWYEGQMKVCFTMFEATRLPDAFIETVHEYDRILVPSLQNVELFSRYHPDVRLCMLGVDPTEWHFVKRTPPGRDFVFLIGGSGPRKGTDLAYEAFRKVFASWPHDRPVPRLIMKNPTGEAFDPHERVEVISGYLSPEQERALYARAHCYVQPSRGEGFGLQPLQAIAQGLPTVLTAAHGHEPFADLGYGVPARLSKAGNFMLGDAGEWWEPDFGVLCEQMRYVYDHYDEACGVAATGAATVAARFTWADTARQFVEQVGADNLAAPYSGSGEWVEPQPRLFRIVTDRDYYCEVAGHAMFFPAGVDKWETADIKRLLFDAGVLDPVCVDDDMGVDAARVEDYRARHSFCPTCHQRLGSGETQADVELAAINA